MPTVPNKTNSKLPVGDVTPEEAAVIRSSIATREQAPVSRVQSELFGNWQDVRDALGSPFEVERIPISKLRQMRRDPMLGFGLSFTKMPHVRAKWYIDARSGNGPNPQIAAHLDHDLRRIYASLVQQCLNSLDFGFQAIAKRFEFRIPSGTYIETNPETGEQTESAIWSEGGIDPIAWKPFVALPPEMVNPLWTGAGDFNGIEYDPASGGAASSDAKASKIDVYHSLWFTNAKEENFNSIFGYPRLGYAYRYWWSYWFRWAIADRAFERKADPSVIVRHPEQELDLGNGETMSAREYALLMGERMRSGGVLALPSEPYEDMNGRGTIPMWDVDFTKDAINFEPFDASFEYLDVQKLRSLFIPEQAFLEGKGGTSSRNVAAEMGNSFVESQAVLHATILEHINRFVIPQWIAVNYPEFLAEGGKAEIVSQGFADEDVEFTNQVVQLIGQQESGMQEVLKLVDLKKLLDSKGVPIASYAEQQRREQQIIEQQQAAQAPTGPAIPLPGGTAPVPSQTGFSYVGNWRSESMLELADSGQEFLESLPDSIHYTDKTVRSHARTLWNTYRKLYRDEYEQLITAFEEGEDDLSLADFDSAKEALLNAKGSSLWEAALTRTVQLLGNIFKRAVKVEITKTGKNGRVSQDEIDEWVRQHVAEFAVQVAETTRGEVADFVRRKMEDGVADREEIAKAARSHFVDFADWKADRLVRTEVARTYNRATLAAAEAVGADQVQALDAQHGESDPDCDKRDGKLFSIAKALKEKEHPNGTLAWKVVPVTLSLDYDTTGAIEGAEFDPETNVVWLSAQLSDEAERKILKQIVNSL